VKKIINTSKAPSAIGTYSQAIKANGFLFTSGQLGIDPSCGKLVDGGVRMQSDRALKNIDAILNKSGVKKENIIKLSVFLINLKDFQHINDSFSVFFDDNLNFPARTTIEVNGLPLNALVEIDCIAFLNK
jgi:2-iminobutanoate/2-iminopropanoate deaminase